MRDSALRAPLTTAAIGEVLDRQAFAEATMAEDANVIREAVRAWRKGGNVEDIMLALDSYAYEVENTLAKLKSRG